MTEAAAPSTTRCPACGHSARPSLSDAPPPSATLFRPKSEPGKARPGPQRSRLAPLVRIGPAGVLPPAILALPDPTGEGEPAMPDPKGEGDLAMDKTETLPLAPPHSSASASLQSDEAARLQRPNSPGLSEAAAASLAASSRGGFSRPADEVYWLQRVFANGLAASRARANEAADVRAALMLRFSSRFSSTTKAGDSPAPSLRGATGFPLLAEAFLFCRPGRSWQPEEPADVGSPSVWAADRVFYAPLLFPKIAEFAAKLGLDPNERYARWDPEREGFVFATVKSDLLCLAARGAVGCPADGVGAPDRANFARALRALASN